MQTASEKTERVYYMDLARATILLTGVFFHAALVYYDHDNQLHLTWFPNALNGLIGFIRTFRMEALFLVSGFFSAVLVSSRGVKGFFRNRTVRMGVPLFFCGLIFNPIPYLFFDPPFVPWAHLDFFLQGKWEDHLWNIAHLLIYETLVFSFLLLFPKIHNKLAVLRLPLPAVLVGYMVILYGLINIWNLLPSIPSSRMLFWPSQFPVFAPAYLLGYLIHQNKELRDKLLDWKLALPMTIAIYLIRRLCFSHSSEAYGQELLHWVDMFQHLIRTILLFSIVRAFETRNIWVKRISIASYSIYLLHVPVQLLLISFFPAMRQGYVAFLLLGLIPILSIWVFHVQVVERWNWAGFLFNGKVYDQKTRSF